MAHHQPPLPELTRTRAAPQRTEINHPWAARIGAVRHAERDIEVDHVTIYRWVQRFTPLLIDAVWPCRHCPGDRWFVDETALLH
jgi:hypothetical protein